MAEWISVKDRLPDEGVKCIVVCDNKNIYTADLIKDEDGDYFWEDNYGYWLCNVTHWMPMPKPPKEDA